MNDKQKDKLTHAQTFSKRCLFGFKDKSQKYISRYIWSQCSATADAHIYTYLYLTLYSEYKMPNIS